MITSHPVSRLLLALLLICLLLVACRPAPPILIVHWSGDGYLVYYDRVSHQAVVCPQSDAACIANPFQYPLPKP